MQVTKEIKTLWEANKNSFSDLGLTYTEDGGILFEVKEGVDLDKLGVPWDAAKAKISWLDLEVRQGVLLAYSCSCGLEQTKPDFARTQPID